MTTIPKQQKASSAPALQDLLERAAGLPPAEQERLAARWAADLDGKAPGGEDESLRVLDLLPVLIWRSDSRGQCDYFNRTWQEFTGRPPEDELGEGWMDGVHPEDAQSCQATYREAVRAQRPFSVEYRLRHHSGDYRWVLATGRPYTGGSGEIAGFVGTCFDLTERKRMEQALMENEARFVGLFEQSPDAIVVVDPDGIIQQVNRQAESMFRYRRAELVGRPLNALIPPEAHGRHSGNILQYMSRPHIRPMGAGLNLEACRSDGSRFPVDITLAPLKFGGVKGARATIRDITERLKVEQALRDSEARFHTIFDEATIGILLADEHGRIEEANPAVLNMLNYTPEQLRKQSFREVAHPADAEGIYSDLMRLISGEAGHVVSEKRFIRSDGQVVWGRLAMSMMDGLDGQGQLALGMLEDITLQREMEAELAEVQRRLIDSAEAERLHLAQELHDGPLQELYAMGYTLRFLEDTLPVEKRDSFEQLHVTIQGVGGALREICGELRPPALAPYGLEKAIRSHAEQLARHHPDVTIRLDLQPDHKLLSERVRFALYRIYQSAVSNALRHSGASEIAIRFRLDKEQIVLEVRDNGRGFDLPRRTVELVREGHFGIVGAMERAEAVGGRLEVSAKRGEGAAVRAVVPRVEELQVAPRERFRALLA